jgi:hypothetical protein
MSLRTSVCGLAVILVVATFAVAVRAQGAPSFGGTYVFVGGDPQRAAVSQAIDDVVAQLSAVLRGLANERLHARVGVAPQMILRPEGDRLHIEHPPLPPRTVPVDGSALPMRNLAGDRVSVTYRMVDGALVEVISQGRSSQTNRYRLSPDGSQITFDAAIRSPVLPAVIRYRLTYRRQG